MTRFQSFFLIGVLATLTLTACSHFQGPGDFKTGADYAPNSATASSDSAGASVDRELAGIAHDYQIGFHWPVSHVRITQGFHSTYNPRHKGIDIGGYRGMPVMASKTGRVIYTGHRFRGYGNMVLIEHPGEMATLYAHLSRIKVHRGQTVKAGTLVGLMGRTGHATGVHLHFEVMHDHQPLDPMLFLNEPQIISYK